jgi:putative membrane protein
VEPNFKLQNAMKHKLTIIAPLTIALAVSLCAYQPASAQEEETTSSPASDEAKTSETTTSDIKTSEAKTAKATKTEKSNLSSTDRRFVENAAKGGMMEVSMGRAASSRAQSNDVKQFGDRMVRDHSKANNELKSIAAKKGITVAREEPAGNFRTDRAYMEMMVKDHEKDLAEFQQEARNGSDPDLKRFADKTSKIISEHLTMARRITKDLKQGTSNLTR